MNTAMKQAAGLGDLIDAIRAAEIAARRARSAPAGQYGGPNAPTAIRLPYYMPVVSPPPPPHQVQVHPQPHPAQAAVPQQPNKPGGSAYLIVPNCPPGQVVWAKYNSYASPSFAGKTIQLDADTVTWLRNNPTYRYGIDYFFCAPPVTHNPPVFGPLHGLPNEDNMTMQAHPETLQMAAGLGSLFAGLGIIGPWAGQDVKIDAKTYEITGTEVGLFADDATLPEKGTLVNPSTPGVIAFFNTAYGANGGKIAGVPDQFAADGQVSNTGGRKWAHGTVSKATNAGQTDPEHPGAVNASPQQTGWVPVDYMADVGWTASNGGTGPIPQNKGGGNIQPASDKTITDKTTDYTPYILGGAAVVGVGIIGWALLSKKKGRGGHRRRAHA